MRCIERLVPVPNGLRRTPAQIADGRRGVRNAQEYADPVLDESTNGTLGSPNDRSILTPVRRRHRGRQHACCQQ